MSDRLPLAEAPAVFQPTVASLLCIEKALIVQYIHEDAIDSLQSRHHDGYWWCTKKIEEMRKTLYFIKERSFKQYLSDLQKAGIVVSIEQRMNGPWDHSKWWRINLDVLEQAVNLKRRGVQ